jgi:hypothetical protein
MSRLGAGHVWEMHLESGLGAEYAWLTQKNAERPDMFDQSFWNPARGSDMSGLTEVFGGRIDFLETVVTGMTNIENGSDRYLLTDSKN